MLPPPPSNHEDVGTVRGKRDSPEVNIGSTVCPDLVTSLVSVAPVEKSGVGRTGFVNVAFDLEVMIPVQPLGVSGVNWPLVDERGEGEGVSVNGRIVGTSVGVVVPVVDCEVVEALVVTESEVVGSGVLDSVVVVEVCEVIVGVALVTVAVVVVDEKPARHSPGTSGTSAHRLSAWLKVHGVSQSTPSATMIIYSFAASAKTR